MPNKSSIIRTHNRQILEGEPNKTSRKCNCRKSTSCPLRVGCQTENVVYLAQVTNNKSNELKSYIGAIERSFKDRLYNHRNSPRYKTKAMNTELSKYVWALKDENTDEISIQWSILDKAPPYTNGSKTCHLCLTEKFHIIFRQECDLLNKRSEILLDYRHKNKFLSANFKVNPPGN